MDMKQNCTFTKTVFQKSLEDLEGLIDTNSTLSLRLSACIYTYYFKLSFIIAMALIAIFLSYYEVVLKLKELKQSECIECSSDNTDSFEIFFSKDEVKLIDGFVITNNAKIAQQNCKSVDKRLCKGVSNESK